MGVVIAAASLAVTAVSAYKQYEAAQDAADAREEAQEIAGAQQQNRARNQRRQQVREERIRRARILASAENTGVGASSSAIGALGALGTNTAANIGFMSSEGRAAQGITSANQSALDAQTRGQMWQGVGQLSSSVFNASGGFGAIGSLWEGGNTGAASRQPTNFMDETFTF